MNDCAVAFFKPSLNVLQPRGYSKESLMTQKANDEAVMDFSIPESRRTWIREFYTLTSKWQSEAQHLSLVTEIAMHPAYQQIIGMGESALPLILRELETKPNHWFWALKAITGEDPVPPSQRGNIHQMIQSWLNWARENNISW
ncbi:MAG: hypothetical protein V1709_10880 [Planctomycetota bacterium]